MKLTPTDLRFVAQRLPRDVRELLKAHAGQLFVGGGFVRAIIAGETPTDIDLFGLNEAWLNRVARELADKRTALGERTKLHSTGNAVTLLSADRIPLQFITRWTFDNAAALVASFDFTVCQAAIWQTPGIKSMGGAWQSEVSDRFYVDLAARRLFYTNPVREEEAGGSLLRVIKYVKRGYSIQPESLGDVVGRIVDKIDHTSRGTLGTGRIVAGLLREVDPLLVVDGFEVVNDHEPLGGF